VRNGLVILGVVLLLVGLVWVGQGLGYIKGSFMTGDVKWFWIGVVVGVAGIALAVGALRTGRRQSRV